jgi:hypothetical protein
MAVVMTVMVPMVEGRTAVLMVEMTAESAESAESAVSGAAAAGAAAAGAAAVVSSSSPQARVREGLVALRRQLAEMALALAALEAASEAAFR